MTSPELAHLELLAEIDALNEALDRWASAAPDWPSARTCQALIRRLIERIGSTRIRLAAPLVVATLGGTGTGKSALVNALVGREVTETGPTRPTTRLPKLIGRPDLTPEMLAIDPSSVDYVAVDEPALVDLVLIDCPDPDTTESPEAASTNLARLRRLLPHCDVLLVTSTQQKYRSARVADELAAAAPGARLVFVQTHADRDQDVRDDWAKILAGQYTTGHIFLVDSLSALADARNDRPPRGEFAGLVDLLTRQLAGAAAVRIRRANCLDLVADTLAVCRQRLDEAIAAQRSRLAARLAEQMRSELLASRRPWESRLVGKVASRWGFSPFALVLRLFHGLGGLVAGSLLFRARTPAQIALWGAMQGARTWHERRRQRRADLTADRAVMECWGQAELREAALVLDGYASEAELDREGVRPGAIADEAQQAGQAFVDAVAGDLEALVDRLARRHTGWFTRWCYELLLMAMMGLLLARLGKNFFYDSWLADVPAQAFGLDVYLVSGFWMVLWCSLLLWAFTSRLRRGLKREINRLAESWNTPRPAEGVFHGLASSAEKVHRFRRDLDRLDQHVGALRRRLALPDAQLGRRR